MIELFRRHETIEGSARAVGVAALGILVLVLALCVWIQGLPLLAVGLLPFVLPWQRSSWVGQLGKWMTCGRYTGVVAFDPEKIHGHARDGSTVTLEVAAGSLELRFPQAPDKVIPVLLAGVRGQFHRRRPVQALPPLGFDGYRDGAEPEVAVPWKPGAGPWLPYLLKTAWLVACAVPSSVGLAAALGGGAALLYTWRFLPMHRANVALSRASIIVRGAEETRIARDDVAAFELTHGVFPVLRIWAGGQTYAFRTGQDQILEALLSEFQDEC